MLTFERISPEKAGIPANSIRRFTQRLREKQIPMHSFLLARGDKLCFEGYYAPCTADMPHRMFSISKNFTAVAVFLLAEEKLLTLDDPIVSHFPEKLPEKVHPWISSMTIRDMLMMRSCHAATTYKADMASDWVESYFTTPPTHPAGTLFHYDTSAPHTLCALVEKLTGMDMLDFLKEKLSPLGLSADSYMLKDPFGVSMGGTGLVALPMDLLKFGFFLLRRGNVCGEQLLPASCLDLAFSNLTATCVTAPIPGEAQGYGMQFWRGQKNNFLCYGMGGQFILVFPDYDLICVTTADTQSVAGGNQQIYDAFYEEILPCIQNDPLPETEETRLLLSRTLESLRLEPLPDSELSAAVRKMMPTINGRTFRVQAGSAVFENFCLQFNSENTADGSPDGGSLSFVCKGQACRIDFGIGRMRTGSFPLYHMHYAASGAWLSDDTFYIQAHILDAYVGCVQFQLSFQENSLTVFLRKKEESLFGEFDGHLYCTCDLP